MKGIILSGGNGTRLNPITISYSKQLVPVFDKPLIYYPLSTLMSLNIRDILIIVKSNQKNNFKTLLKDGSQFGISIKYAIQDEPNGIAEAFLIGKTFIKNDPVALILGDNIFYGQNINKNISNFDLNNGSVIFLYQVKNPTQYGVANFKNDKIINIIEKPKKYLSNYAVTGLYIYDSNVVNLAKKLTPSKRKELEISDLNNIYIKKNRMVHIILKNTSVWFDAGTSNSLLFASQYIQAIQERNNILIGSPEEVAYKKKFINKKDFKYLLKSMPDNLYYQILSNLLNSK